ncbi:MAG: RluA family pseudouridine synthase [Nitrospirae bacterium]|nr:RluA family pseudouridine synthase [Nitrospirota bacterium]
MKTMTIKETAGPGHEGTVMDFLCAKSGLSRSRIKDAMSKGAVRIKKNIGKMLPERKGSCALSSGDYVEFYYDEQLLSRKPPVAKCLRDLGSYSVWFKPAGLMSQGTKFGDHCSILRQVEKHFQPARKVFPVHRLDREASGIILVAHNRDAAAKLSELFQSKKVEKEYRIEALGNVNDLNSREILFSLDGSSAITEFTVISFDPEKNSSAVTAIAKTGRYHQVRRHFNMAGHPVMGDPRYGQGNKNTEGMKLSAVALRYHCPVLKKEVEFRVSDEGAVSGAERC